MYQTFASLTYFCRSEVQVFSKRYRQMFVIIAANNNLATIRVYTMVVSKLPYRRQERVWVPVENIFFWPLSKGRKG